MWEGEGLPGLDLTRDRIAGRVDIHLDGAFEQPPCRFEKTASEILVETLLEELPEGGESDGQPDEPIGIGGQIFGDLVVEREPRDQDVAPPCTEDGRAGEEVLVSPIRSP